MRYGIIEDRWLDMTMLALKIAEIGRYRWLLEGEQVGWDGDEPLLDDLRLDDREGMACCVCVCHDK